ncbi:shikimate kinase [Pleomorphomonas sp. PLEO]|uniref:shikimate kinase n=1 Tax=Pleomorphomonas sp. PLEO TaxID=3239306 RepID=UPI00351E3371
MRTIIVVSGPINAGKTTIGRALAKAIDGAVFIDGDDHDAPEDAPLALRIEAGLQRLSDEIAGNTARWLVIAYPLRNEDHERLLDVAQTRDARLLTVTLAPPLEVCLSDRGSRVLDDGERARICEMYTEGYHQRAFSDLVVSAAPSVDVAVNEITAWLNDVLTEL